MGKRIDQLIASLSEVFEGEPWYGESVMRKLENVSYIIGDKTCLPESHNVAQIVAHLISWKNFAIEKLRSNGSFNIKIDSKQDWPEVEVQSRKDWEDLKHELVVAQNDIYDFLKDKSDHFLDEKVAGRDYTYDFLLKGIIQHDIYHLGQIGLIQSQLKNQEKHSGVFKS
ncbi:DinB family protein [Christiangramia fulva]|nr:DinB family protein [Christiangramia fulva]